MRVRLSCNKGNVAASELSNAKGRHYFLPVDNFQIEGEGYGLRSSPVNTQKIIQRTKNMCLTGTAWLKNVHCKIVRFNLAHYQAQALGLPKSATGTATQNFASEHHF